MNWIAVKVSFCLTRPFHHQRHTIVFHCTRRKKKVPYDCGVSEWVLTGQAVFARDTLDDDVWRHLTWMCLRSPLCTAQHHNHSYNCIECWLANPSCAVQMRQHALIRHRFRIKSSNMRTELVDLPGLPLFQHLNQSGSTGVTAAE